MSASRRCFVQVALTSPALLLGIVAVVRAADALVCVDLDALPASQKGLRRSLGFKLESPDANKRCGRCTFFTATDSGCGKCQLLSGGTVTAGSVCDSWAAKS
jgi:High potential iron-sulfur protein